MKTCLNELKKLTNLDGIAPWMTDPPPANSATALGGTYKHIYIYIYFTLETLRLSGRSTYLNMLTESDPSEIGA